MCVLRRAVFAPTARVVLHSPPRLPQPRGQHETTACPNGPCATQSGPRTTHGTFCDGACCSWAFWGAFASAFLFEHTREGGSRPNQRPTPKGWGVWGPTPRGEAVVVCFWFVGFSSPCLFLLVCGIFLPFALSCRPMLPPPLGPAVRFVCASCVVERRRPLLLCGAVSPSLLSPLVQTQFRPARCTPTHPHIPRAAPPHTPTTTLAHPTTTSTTPATPATPQHCVWRCVCRPLIHFRSIHLTVVPPRTNARSHRNTMPPPPHPPTFPRPATVHCPSVCACV